ncbi:hypothetical protein SDC9_208051 [bioreactor metagenome]|uniref:Uncharacterized protein n=1 Tax=bioreactor metagenome TaxID=1076179 RepID=A0A645JL11_9ZZZZ
MAQRQPVALPPDGARLRHLLRPHLRPLGRILRPAAGTRRAHGAGQGLHRGRLHRRGAGLHRAQPSAPLLLLRALHHAPLAVGRARQGLAAFQGHADRAVRHPPKPRSARRDTLRARHDGESRLERRARPPQARRPRPR